MLTRRPGSGTAPPVLMDLLFILGLELHQHRRIPDGITGGTITSKGVDEMLNRTMGIYLKYFNKATQRAQR